MKKLVFILMILAAHFWVAPSYAHKIPEKVNLFFISPTNGQTVSSPFIVKMGLTGMPIAAVGVDKHKAGHHHILIDVKKPISMDDPIPNDKKHMHMNKGETEVTMNLPKGKHILQLILGDEEHEPWGEELISRKINITVK
jgi:hypothetical protein